jgi:hypothetical protein
VSALRLLILGVSLVLLGPLLGGCGRGPRPFEVTTPCKLLTEEEVGAATQVKVTARDLGRLDLHGPVAYECRWLDQPNPASWVVRVTVSNEVGLYRLPEGAVPIDGLGDRAYLVQDIGDFVTIELVRGNYLVSIQFPVYAPHKMTSDAGKRLASQAVARLA